MNVIISIFSNSEKYLDTYFKQIASLKERPYLLLLEGDSSDKTYEKLCHYMRDYKGQVLKRNKGQIYGSIVSEARFKQLAELWNELLDLIPIEADKVCIIESDLVWDSETLEFLLELSEDYKFVCPLVERDNLFYDIWGYRYTEEDCFVQDLARVPEQITELYSAGSFLVMQAEIARQNRISETNAIIGFCESSKDKPFCIPTYVWHP